MTLDNIPIIPIEENYLLSLQGDVRDDELTSLKDRLFQELSTSDIKGLIVDVSGLSTMDSFMARSLNELAKGAELNGLETYLVGIQPEVAMTLVQMGLSIPEVKAEQSVGRALEKLRN